MSTAERTDTLERFFAALFLSSGLGFSIGLGWLLFFT